jgi:hypothetical protein
VLQLSQKAQAVVRERENSFICCFNTVINKTSKELLGTFKVSTLFGVVAQKLSQRNETLVQFESFCMNERGMEVCVMYSVSRTLLVQLPVPGLIRQSGHPVYKRACPFSYIPTTGIWQHFNTQETR